jgi:hypothetical protein
MDQHDLRAYRSETTRRARRPVRWQIKVTAGAFTGTHTFRTKRDAVAFLATWRKAEDLSDAGAVLLRDGREAL